MHGNSIPEHGKVDDLPLIAMIQGSPSSSYSLRYDIIVSLKSSTIVSCSELHVMEVINRDGGYILYVVLGLQQ